jgi:hypothetical protein
MRLKRCSASKPIAVKNGSIANAFETIATAYCRRRWTLTLRRENCDLKNRLSPSEGGPKSWIACLHDLQNLAHL